MATEAAYPNNPFEVPDKRRGGNTSKRKRDSLDNLGSVGRAAPNTRRASAQNVVQQQTPSALTNPIAAVADMGTSGYPPVPNGGNEDSAQQFDFSLQQPGSSDGILGQGAPGQDSGNVDTATAALNQHYNMQVPNDDSYPGQGGNEAVDSTFNLDDNNAFQGLDDDGDGSGGRKPPVGSEEWHKVRKDNHKEVERRRRETINEGINELAKIVPNCEKNKGAVLQRAVQYIQRLQEEATQNIDKWTFEKLVTEQAIDGLSSKLAKTWEEKEAYKKKLVEMGVDLGRVHVEAGIAPDGAAGAVGNAVTGGAQTQNQGQPAGVGNAASAVQAVAQAVENQATTAQMQAPGAAADAGDEQYDAKLQV